MDSSFILIVAFLTGAILGAAVFLWRIIKLERENAQITAALNAKDEALDTATQALDARFAATAQEALQKSNAQFLQLAQEKLKHAQNDSVHDLDKRQKAIDNLIKPVQEQLAAMKTTLEHVQGTDKALREDLASLGKETARLTQALRDPAAQGKWGEFILEGLLEKSGLMKGVHYDVQASMQTAQGTRRPDAVIKMQDGFHIIVDAKAPLNQFAQQLDGPISDAQYTTLTNNLATQVRERIKELSKKNYWENIESPDFTVLFLPSESLYSLALRADAELVDFAAAKNVIIASPTLLISLIRVVALGWRQIDLAQNAQEISALGQELYKRLLKFTDHMDKVGKSISQAMRGYNDAVGSMERSVLPSARKFRDLQGSANNEADITILHAPNDEHRSLQLTADDEKEKAAANES